MPELYRFDTQGVKTEYIHDKTEWIISRIADFRRKDRKKVIKLISELLGDSVANQHIYNSVAYAAQYSLPEYKNYLYKYRERIGMKVDALLREKLFDENGFLVKLKYETKQISKFMVFVEHNDDLMELTLDDKRAAFCLVKDDSYMDKIFYSKTHANKYMLPISHEFLLKYEIGKLIINDIFLKITSDIEAIGMKIFVSKDYYTDAVNLMADTIIYEERSEEQWQEK